MIRWTQWYDFSDFTTCRYTYGLYIFLSKFLNFIYWTICRYLPITIFPHQVPSLSDDLESCDTINNQQYSQYISNLPEQITSPGCNGNTLTWSTSHSPSFLPGMSVNVSMNMTMQGYPPSTSTPVANDDLSPQVPCHQVSNTKTHHFI